MNRIGAGLTLLLVSFSTFSAQEPMTPKAIESRIKQVGEVTIAGEEGAAPAQQATAEPKALGPDAGKKRYNASCSVCHAAGVAGAPKFGDKDAWAPRIAQGMETLIKNAIHGIRAMPPRGTCMNCSDEEIEVTVKYMVDHAS